MNFQEWFRKLTKKMAKKNSLDMQELKKHERNLENKVFKLKCQKEAVLE